jgi:AraC family transcriptional regulator
MLAPPCGCPAQARASRRAGTLTVRRSVYVPQCRLGTHAHAEDRVVVTLAGRWRSTYASRVLETDRGAAVFRPAGVPHRDDYDGPSVCIALLLPSNSEASPLVTRDPDLADAARRLDAELQAVDSSAALVLEGLSAQIAARVFRIAPREGRARWIHAVRDRLEDEYAAPPELRVLATAAGRSPFHLAVVFRATFGVSVGEYVREVRLWRAVRLLERGECALAGVASTAGYADQSHFTRVFRRRFGLSPGMYRARLG